MKYRTMFVTGAAIGYVLGTRAGRERYEQIRRTYRRIAENPTVQETAGLVRAQAEALTDTTKEKVRTKVRDTIGDRLPGGRRGGDEEGEVPRPRPTDSESTLL